MNKKINSQILFFFFHSLEKEEGQKDGVDSSYK